MNSGVNSVLIKLFTISHISYPSIYYKTITAYDKTARLIWLAVFFFKQISFLKIIFTKSTDCKRFSFVL